MDYQDGLKLLTEKIVKYKDQINTEEATKTAFVMPFFDLLGYDTRNPLEFVPEFTADVGIKKGEKVDYAIMMDGQPMILIEAKPCYEALDKHDSQLIRYFHTTQAKIGILTNGIIYRFYTDLEETNKMDSRPFLEINLLNLKDNEVLEIKKFFKTNFDMSSILSTAEELKYSNAIKKVFLTQLDMPDESFVDYFTNEVYEGKKTKNVKEKFNHIVKKSINEVMNDMVRTRLENALNTKSTSVIETETELRIEDTQDKVVTTEEELMAYNIIRSILSERIDLDRVSFKDTTNYMNILIDNKTTKWVSRLYLNTKNKYIAFPVFDGNTREERILIERIEDIYKHKAKCLEIINAFANIKVD